MRVLLSLLFVVKMYDSIDQNHAFLQIFEMNSGRSQCVTSSELLRSEEEEEKAEDKHFVIEISFDDVGDDHDVDDGED